MYYPPVLIFKSPKRKSKKQDQGTKLKRKTQNGKLKIEKL